MSDAEGARRLLGGLAYFVPRRKTIWADAGHRAYRGKELAEWCQQQGEGWDLEVVERTPGTQGFQLLPRRWVIERSLAWLSRNRRLARDYERMVQTSETLIELAAMRLLARRLAHNQDGSASSAQNGVPCGAGLTLTEEGIGDSVADSPGNR
jgi:putative transposase